MPITMEHGKIPYTTHCGTQIPVRLSSNPTTPVPTPTRTPSHSELMTMLLTTTSSQARVLSERRSVQGAEYSEHRQRTGYEISAKKGEEDEIADNENRPSGETVHYITAERPYNQRHYGIAGEAQANCLLVCAESFREVQRKQRDDQREGKMNEEISYPYLQVVCVPELRLCRFRQVFHLLHPIVRRNFLQK